MSSYYLKRNIVAEPLVDGWYAWAHLIPPATLSRNITERHLKIIESYIESSETHEAAVKDPRLLGGPFMDLKQRRVQDVTNLRERTLHERGHLIALSGAIEQLDGLLREKAAGFSLEPLYREVPQALQGYVELVYDLNNHPSFRLIEPLLYKSPYYNCWLQTMALHQLHKARHCRWMRLSSLWMVLAHKYRDVRPRTIWHLRRNWSRGINSGEN